MRRWEPRAASNGGVYQFNIPRAESISEGGMAVPPSMGTAIAINFEPTGGGRGAITAIRAARKEVNRCSSIAQ